ncbi:MAG: hypothetical protein ACE5EI_06420 [Thermodesulfobacteriota bacterium]
MKKFAVLVAAALLVAGCAAEKALEKPEEAVRKVETPMWKLINFYTNGSRENPIWYQDEWFVYRVELEYIKSGAGYESAIFTSCPVAGARQTVWDRKSEEFVREASFKQMPCDPCHRR